MIRNNNQQNGRRRGRGGQGGGMGGGAPRPQGQNFGNNRLDIRQRGNATQLLDKYKTLARDAAQQGDRVVSEYYLQYADHYFRVLNEIRERQPEHQRGPRPGYDADEDGDDVGNGYNPAYAAGNEAAQQQQDADQGEQGYGGNGQQDGRRDGQRDGQRDAQQADRGQRQYEDRPRQDRQDGRAQQDRQQDARQQDNRQQDNRQQDGRQQDGRRDEFRRERSDQRPERTAGADREPRADRGDREPRAERVANGRGEYRDTRREPRDDYRDESVRADDDRAGREPADHDDAPMIAGLPGPATLSPVAAAPEAGADGTEEAPKRRRGRPRKVVESTADPIDA